jgi:tRNA G10  N-methylase Trm11
MSSSNVGDTVFDPFAGTGTTLVVAKQLKRNAMGIDIDHDNVKLIQRRLREERTSDDISKYFDYYRYTDGIASILGVDRTQRASRSKSKQATLFEK